MEVRHASRNADSACPFLYWCDGKKKEHAESAFVTHVVPPLLSMTATTGPQDGLNKQVLSAKCSLAEAGC